MQRCLSLSCWMQGEYVQDGVHTCTADMTAFECGRNGLARRETGENLQIGNLGVQNVAFHQQREDEAEIELDRTQRGRVFDSPTPLHDRLALCNWGIA